MRAMADLLISSRLLYNSVGEDDWPTREKRIRSADDLHAVHCENKRTRSFAWSPTGCYDSLYPFRSPFVAALIGALRSLGKRAIEDGNRTLIVKRNEGLPWQKKKINDGRYDCSCVSFFCAWPCVEGSSVCPTWRRLVLFWSPGHLWRRLGCFFP